MAKVVFEPTPATATAPSNTETTLITTAALRSPKYEFHGTVLC